MNENYNFQAFLSNNRKSWLCSLFLLLCCGLAPAAFAQGPCTQTAPFTESFSSGSLPSCWTNTTTYPSTSSNVLWKFDGSPSYGASPSDNGKPNGTYAWVDASVPNTGVHDVTLTSPQIDLTGLTAPFLKFDWFKNNDEASSGENNVLTVEITDGTTGWTAIFSDTSNAPVWRTEGVLLPAVYQNTTVQVRFVVDKDGSGDYFDDLLLDDVKIIDAPTCIAPQSPVASNVTLNSADVSWTAPSQIPANGYEYYYNTTGIAPIAASPASGSVPSGTTTTITGLSASSTYFVWVRSVCSSTDKSIWSSTSATFSTPCGVAVAPFFEEFSTGALPNCWTNTSSSTSTSLNALWKFDGSPGYGASPSDNGKPNGTYAWVDASSPYTGLHDVTLTTPPIDVSALNAPYLKFEWFKNNDDASSGENNSLTIEVNDGSGWVSVFSDTSNSPIWRPVGVLLPASAQNDTVQIRFVVDKDGSGYFHDDLLLDDIEVKEAPTCFPPQSLVIANITTTGADVSWTAPTPGPANGYEYYYNSTGTPPIPTTTASGSVASGTATTLSGLTPNTDYTIWIRGVCGGDNSVWSAPAVFTTLCLETAPWLYDVETASTTTSSEIEDCWSTTPSNTSSDYSWNVDGSGSTPSSSTGPSGAHSGSHYFYTEASDGITGDIAILTSPLVDVSSVTTPAVKFYYHMYGADMGNLYIEASDATSGWVTIDSIKGQQQTDENDPWYLKIIPITGLGNTIQVRFRAERGPGLTGDMSLDDISIIEAPTCFAPLLPTASGITAISADISWNAPNPAPGSGYEYYYNTTGTPPTAATTASGSVASGTSTTITGLSANTDYTVWIRSVCSSTDKSLWSTAVTFTTPCMETAPWTYDVETANTTTSANISDCWSTTPSNTSSDYRWNVDGSGSTPSSNTGPSGAHSGSNYFYIEDSYGSVGDSAFLYAPMVDISGLTDPMFSFYYHMYGADIGNLYIQLLDASTGAWTTVDSIKGEQQTSENDPWLPFYYGLGSFTGPLQLRLVAVNQGTFSGDISIDDISFVDFPACDPPTAITTDNITESSAILHWTDDTSKSYVLQYGNTGFTLGTGTIVVVDTNDYELTGLDPNTTYDYYIRKVCIPGWDTGAYSQVTTFTTLCNVVSVNLGNDSIICEGTSVTYNAGNPGGTYLWSDNSTSQTLTVSVAGTYSVTVTNQFGCQGFDEVTLTSRPNPVVNLGPDQEICSGATVLLDAGNPGMSYLWSTSETNQTITISSGGDYYVAVTDSNNCIGTDTITIIANLAPIVSGITAVHNSAANSYDFTAQGIQGQIVNSYFWDFGDGQTSTLESPTHTYDHTGNYVVMLVVENGCGTDTVTTILHGIGTGIGELDQLSKEQLMLYPNPATDELTIQNESQYPMQSITVYNILGQKVMEIPAVDAHKYQLNTSNLPSGVYTLQIQLNNGFVMRKFEVMK